MHQPFANHVNITELFFPDYGFSRGPNLSEGWQYFTEMTSLYDDCCRQAAWNVSGFNEVLILVARICTRIVFILSYILIKPCIMPDAYCACY